MIKGAVPLATAPFRLFVSMMFVWHVIIDKLLHSPPFRFEQLQQNSFHIGPFPYV